jgi:hypothetical protein
MNLDELKKLATQAGLKYWVDPDRPVLMMRFSRLFGSFQVVVPLELDGRFLQFRTLEYQSCPSDHPHLEAVLRVLGGLNYRLRLTKFGWDPNDGEIVGYADLWLEDGTVTQKQFRAMLECLLSGIDVHYPRIAKTIETGTDPGDLSREEIAKKLEEKLAQVAGQASGQLPDPLREVLERLKGKKPDEGPREV